MRTPSQAFAAAAVVALFSLPLTSACSSRAAGNDDASVPEPKASPAAKPAMPPQFTPVADAEWSIKQPLVGKERMCEGGKVAVFDCKEMSLLSFLPLEAIGGGQMLNDIWGWPDSTTGREFALVGRNNGTSFVEITDPVNPRYLGDLPLHSGARPASWRDIKIFKNHAFIVADGSGPHGMQVFDLTQLRTVTAPTTFTETTHYANVASVHNIAIDEANGFAYLIGTSSGGETCGGGLHMVDIRDPKNPAFAACHAVPKTGRRGTGYIHDTQCTVYRGPDTKYSGKQICFNAAETALSIVDVTDKNQAQTISVAPYPNVAYAHQGWLSNDHRYFYLGDELDEGKTGANTRTIIFDLKELGDPIVAGEFFGTTAATDHNLYVRGHYIFQSAYASGVRVLDIQSPTALEEVAYFDTNPDDSSKAMNGSWSNYPYFPSGVIAATGMRHGLFILRHHPAASN